MKNSMASSMASMTCSQIIPASQDTDFTWLLGNPHFEDTTILFVGRSDAQEPKLQLQVFPQPDVGPDQELCTVQLHVKQISSVLEHIHVNKAIISTVSEYWRSRTVSGQVDGSSRKRIKLDDGKALEVLEEAIDPAQLPAMKAALHYAYSRQVPSSIPELMEMLASSEQLGSMSADQIGVILSDDLPSVVLSHPCYKRVSDACVDALLNLFGRPQHVLSDTSHDLLEAFCRLPFTAVLLWAQQDGLQVDSENSVAVLITHWWQCNLASTTQQSGQQQQRYKQELSSALRVQHLSTSFFTGVLHQLPWFTTQHVPGALSSVQALREFYRGLPGLLLPDWARQSAPPAWTAAPRTTCDAELVLSWVLTEEQLHALHQGCLEGQWDLASDAFYWKGYEWMLLLNLNEQNSSLYVGITMASALPGVDIPPLASFCFDLRCISPKGRTLKKSTFAKNLLLGQGQATLGCNDFLEVPRTTEPRADCLPPARLMVDGKLHLEVRVRALDGHGV